MDLTFYLRSLSLENARAIKIDHSETMVGFVYRIVQPNKPDFILKISKNPLHYQKERYFLRLVENKIPSPNIVRALPPIKTFYGALLLTCLPGALLQTDNITTPLAKELGTALAKIHSLHTFPGYGNPMKGAFFPNLQAYFFKKFEEGLEECQPQLSSHMLQQARKFYNENSPLLLSASPAVIAHRDFRPGNILVEQGKLTGIIDWAGAGASCIEEDICAIEQAGWLGAKRTAFFKGYQSVRALPDYHALLPLMRLYKLIAILGFMIKENTWHTTHQKLYATKKQELETLLRKYHA